MPVTGYVLQPVLLTSHLQDRAVKGLSECYTLIRVFIPKLYITQEFCPLVAPSFPETRPARTTLYCLIRTT
jgi:hypothetical protein